MLATRITDRPDSVRNDQASVVQKLSNATKSVNHCLLDKYQQNWLHWIEIYVVDVEQPGFECDFFSC